jgi:EmrB/QacA subfamily drug resistance transporter
MRTMKATVTDTRKPAAQLDGQAAAFPRRWQAFAVLCFSLLVIVLDNTILNVALPTIARDLSATASQLQWIVDGYVLVFAGLLLTTGSLGDRFGRKRALTIGFIIFGGASIWAAWSGTTEYLIAARALMGVGGALIMPSTLSITTNIFSGAERTKAIGIWSGVAGISIILGPVTGGWLLQHFWWGSVFLINVPVIVIALVAGYFLIPESRDESAPKLDPAGALLSIGGLTALLYGIIEAPGHGWTATSTLTAFAAATVLLILFVGWELFTSVPMLDVRLFRNPRFTAASLAIGLTSFALFGTVFFLTQYMQFVLGFDALASGVRFIPIALGLTVGAGISSKLVARLGAKVMVTVGLLTLAGGLALLSFATPTSGYGLVAVMLIVVGFGMGLTMVPATDAIMGALPLAKAGVGSAVNDTTRQVGGALGVAILGSLLSSAYRATMDGTAIVQALPAPVANVARDSIGAASVVARQLGGAPATALLDAANSAYIEAMGQTVLVAAAVAVAGALVALCFLPAHAKAPGEQEGEARAGTVAAQAAD